MDEYPESPEDALARMTPADQRRAAEEAPKWVLRYLDQPHADLAAMPFRAFLAGYAYASQWWRD